MEFVERLEQEIAKLRKRRETLVNEIASTDAELKDCETALRVAQKLGAVSGGMKIITYPPMVSVSPAPAPQPVPKFKGQVSKLAIYLLKQAYPTGITAGDLREVAAEKHETDIKPTSLTVALGRHKASGAVRLDGRTWYYVPGGERRGPNDEPSNSADEAEGGAMTDAPPMVTGGLS